MKFRTRTILGVALIEAVVLTVLVGLGLRSLQSSNEAEIERRLAIASRLIVASLRDAMIAQDVATLEGIAAEIVGTGDLAYLRVLDAGRRTLARSGRLPPVERSPDRDLWRIDDDVYDRDVTVAEGGQTFGVVQFGIDVGPVRSLVARSRELAVWISLSGMALVAVFSFALGAYLTRQLLRLRDASLAVASGDLGQRVEERGGEELAQTAAAFNVMVDRLREAQQRRTEDERRKAEDAARLQQQFDELQVLNHRLLEQQSALSQARDAAEAASQAKGRFLATMSHEIRTPMNGMLGMAQLLKDPALTAELRADYVDTLLESGRVLLTLLNDILDLAKVEAGKFELHAAPVDPARLVEETRRLYASPAAAKGLQLSATWEGGAAPVMLDPVRVRQMLGNLVSNAIKFTQAGAVEISGREVSDADGTAVEFAVTDTGVGIPESEHGRLFQPFTQVDESNTRRFGGSGLGLSIVRQLTALMGGTAGFDSAPGRGSRFWIRLPAERARVAASTAAAETAPVPSDAAEALPALSGRVLVVEDNPVNRKLVSAMLRRAGLEPATAEDGLQAIEAVERGDGIDLILMDLQMPVLDGYDATRRIRSLEAQRGLHRLPILALTASAFTETAHRAHDAGMDGFLTKPVLYPELVRSLAPWLARESRSPEAAAPRTAG